MSGSTFLASFDVEDWFHAENVRLSLGDRDWTALEGRVERNTHALLDILAEVQAKSTFFVLGWVARQYPALVRRIADEGHEVASHTDLHRQLWSLPTNELVCELRRSRETLEDITGTRVLGVRAPNFSISEQVLDSIAETGYWYDSSFFSVRAHGRYGRLSAAIDPEAAVVRARPTLLELPLSRVRVGRVAVPWSGGAYFRLIPYPVFRAGVAYRLRTRSWFMFYFHPWELDPDERPPNGMRRSLRIRAYAGRSRMRADLRRLLSEFGSRRIDDSLRRIGMSPP
jgi:polysaccharide deacetylase family protein (PEP-CTERM system associated)